MGTFIHYPAESTKKGHVDRILAWGMKGDKQNMKWKERKGKERKANERKWKERKWKEKKASSQQASMKQHQYRKIIGKCRSLTCSVVKVCFLPLNCCGGVVYQPLPGITPRYSTNLYVPPTRIANRNEQTNSHTSDFLHEASNAGVLQ